MASFKNYTTITLDENNNKIEHITFINMDHVICCKVVKHFYDGGSHKIIKLTFINNSSAFVLVPEKLQGDLVPAGIVLDKVLGYRSVNK